MDRLTYILALLERIPGTFWGIIIGSFFTLGGIILTNRAHDRRLQAQLAQDRDLKNREREMSLRKDIYLAAAEAVAAGMIAVGRFANLDLPYAELTTGYLERAPSITKVHIIAKEKTVKAVANFSNELNATFLRLSARRFPLVAEKEHIGFLRGQIDIFTKEQSRMVELMKQYNLDGLKDLHKWGILQQTFDFEGGRVEQTTQEVNTLNASLIPKQIQYVEEVFDEMIKLGPLLTPILFSIRKELELPIDEIEILRISEEATAKQVESLREYIQYLKSLIPVQPVSDGGISPVPSPPSAASVFSPKDTSPSA